MDITACAANGNGLNREVGPSWKMVSDKSLTLDVNQACCAVKKKKHATALTAQMQI